MASGNGVAGSKRKLGEGSGSGDEQEYPGDPPTAAQAESGFLGVTEVDHAEDTGFSGVGVRVRVLTEIKNWARSSQGDRKGRGFLVDVNRTADVETRKVAAAIIHDCARLYWDPGHPVKGLNILRVERWLRKVQKLEVLSVEDCIRAKRSLDEYVQSHPVAPAPLEWKGLDEHSFNALKNEIVNRGLDFFEVLKGEVAKLAELSRAGRQRQDEAEIWPRVEENEPANLDSEDDIKRLEYQIACMKVAHAEELRARDNQIAELAKQKETDDVIIVALLKIIDKGARQCGLRFFDVLSWENLFRMMIQLDTTVGIIELLMELVSTPQ